jgi:Zn-finger nucleic acid-binding protein
MRLDECTKCGGVFVDVALTNAIVRGPSRAVAEAIFKLSQVREFKTEAVSEPLSCPECGAQMQRQQIPSAVCDIDICPDHGTWFDAAEVYKVSKALASARKHRHGG